MKHSPAEIIKRNCIKIEVNQKLEKPKLELQPNRDERKNFDAGKPGVGTEQRPSRTAASTEIERRVWSVLSPLQQRTPRPSTKAKISSSKAAQKKMDLDRRTRITTGI
jgi:hypothetical protein